MLHFIQQRFAAIQAPAGSTKGDHTMRSGLILAGAFMAMSVSAMSPTGAQAEEYCGFNPRPGSIVQCGYSSLEGCENAIGKGAMCFVNPYLALNTRRASPLLLWKPRLQRG
jgi:hypothetical protein